MDKALAVEIRALKCDAPGCTFNQDLPHGNAAEFEKWLNKPCPLCGANLLTEADLEAIQRVELIAILANAMFKPGEDEKRVIVPIQMDGTGKITLGPPREE